MTYIVKVKLPIGWWTAFQTPSFTKALDKYCRLAKQKHSVRLASYDWFCTIYVNGIYGFVFICNWLIFAWQKKMKDFINKCIVMFMNLFDRGDDIDWLNMHNDMIEKRREKWEQIEILDLI